MSQIKVSDLTFSYETSYDNIFENVSFQTDTDWKLGFIGRNGKGKTTLFRLLMGEYEYRGSIQKSTVFQYFPYQISKDEMKENTIDIVEAMLANYELWKVCRELDLLDVNSEVLYRPFESLSHGERTKVMLATLFSEEGQFLLIDEPTNHLDLPARKKLVEYLKQKKGYILISHDRWFLDQCVDHLLVLNRNTIEVCKGNFSGWWENKEKKDAYELAQNEKLKRQIKGLEISARRSGGWADYVESTKIGFDPVKDPDRSIGSRSYIGTKSMKMQRRAKNLERRKQEKIDEKKELLKDLERIKDLKMFSLDHHKQTYVEMKDISMGYEDEKYVIRDFSMCLNRGDRILLSGGNGSGKSTIIKTILSSPNVRVLGGKNECFQTKNIIRLKKQGELNIANELIISYINQDTSGLKGSLKQYIEEVGIEEHLFKAILRHLDFDRIQFEKNMEDYSEGQKKKVLIASSLLQEAHLYIWDEPLNYIDVFSRMQIERLLEEFKPSMLLVEHDQAFSKRIVTKKLNI
jgi:lincosamide and streptogramin A transport system ATP-binding/permease protein